MTKPIPIRKKAIQSTEHLKDCGQEEKQKPVNPETDDRQLHRLIVWVFKGVAYTSVAAGLLCAVILAVGLFQHVYRLALQEFMA